MTVALAACGDDSSESAGDSSSESTEVIFMLDYGVDASTSGLAYGVENDIFEEHGIDIKVEPGSGSEITAQSLEQGKADIGIVDLEVYLQHRLEGVDKTQAVWAYGDTPSTALLTLGDYEDPGDLVGAEFATVAGSAGIQAVETVLVDNGLESDAVELVLLDYSVLYQSLFKGDVDLAEYHVGGDEGALIEAERQGLSPRVLPLAEWGLVGYPQTLVVNKEFLGENPDAVSDFIAALVEATEAAADASDDDVFAALQGLDPTVEKEAIILGRQGLEDLGSGSGPIEESVIEQTMNRLRETTGVDSDLTAQDVFTNDYAP